MLIGYSPEVIQAAYRIGDSSTNINHADDELFRAHSGVGDAV